LILSLYSLHAVEVNVSTILTVHKSQVIEIAFIYNKIRHHRRVLCARHLTFYFLFSLQKVKNKIPSSAHLCLCLVLLEYWWKLL